MNLDEQTAARTSAGAELLELVERAEAALVALHAGAEARAWAAAPVDRAQVLQRLARTGRVGDAAHLALVRSLSRAEAFELGGTSVADLLTRLLRQPSSRSQRDVLAARATDPQRPAPEGGLPQTAAALASGEVSLEHVDTALRAIDKLPVPLQREAADAIDAFMAEHARRCPPQECTALAEVVLDRIDPDRHDRGYDPDAYLRRGFSMTTDAAGMVVLSGQLDPATGAQLKAAIDHYSAPRPAVQAQGAQGQESVRVADERTARQRRADAVGILARQGLAPGARDTRGGEPPRVLVTGTLEQFQGARGAGRARSDQVGVLSPAVLARLAEAATLQAVVLSEAGAVLRLGRSVRLFTTAQRKALLARDGGCVIPCCDAPPAWLEAHHVVPWAEGGLTDVDGGALACGSHHTAITMGVWQVRMVDGLPQVRGPGVLDPLRRWVAGGRRPAERAAEALGTQLHLDLREVRERALPPPRRRSSA